MNHDHHAPLDRRELLRGASVLGLGAAGLGLLPASAAAAVSLAPSDLFRGSCTLTPGQIQGPYYHDLNLVRRDITEGLPGIPVHLRIRVLDVDACTPLVGAEVDVWHTNAPGDYSNFAVKGTEDETWMRGVQFTDADGIATFHTIYPGWYVGRTTHAHVKVYPQTGWQLTTQLYFADVLSNLIYRLPPYSSHGPKDTTNAQDGFHRPDLQLATQVALDPTTPGLLLVTAGITLVVNRP